MYVREDDKAPNKPVNCVLLLRPLPTTYAPLSRLATRCSCATHLPRSQWRYRPLGPLGVTLSHWLG